MNIGPTPIPADMNTQNWKILLIGGSSGTGKSLLARQLSKHFEIPLTEVDDIRIALQKIADRNKHPDLFTFWDNPDFLETKDAEILADKLLDIGREVWIALDTLITKHLVCDEPVIFEGDGIIPDLLAQRDQKGIVSVFLWDEVEHIERRVEGRQRPGTQKETSPAYAEFSYRFGLKLKEQALANGFIVVQSSPAETLLARVLKQLEK